MVNKCAVFGCKRGYESEEPQHEDYHAFYFPLDERESHLLPAWEKFVCRDGWKPSANSVICEFHVEDRLIRKGKRWTLKWKLNPMPTMLTDEMKAMPQSVQPTPAAPLLFLLCLVSMKLKLLNRLLIRVAKKFPLLLRVTSPKNWQKGLIATVVNRYLLQVQWTWQKAITSTFFLVADLLSHLQNWLSILAIVLRSWITHTRSFKHTVSGMCGQHILKFLIGYLPKLTFVVQNITIGD